MENKEFDLERYNPEQEWDYDRYYATMESNSDGDFVRHEEHLTTIQLVADELIKFYSTLMENAGASKVGIELMDISAKNLIQSKFTDRIWTGGINENINSRK